MCYVAARSDKVGNSVLRCRTVYVRCSVVLRGSVRYSVHGLGFTLFLMDNEIKTDVFICWYFSDCKNFCSARNGTVDQKGQVENDYSCNDSLKIECLPTTATKL